MNNKKIFLKGIAFYPPSPKAPEWILGRIVITPREMFDWVKDNVSLLQEKEGKKRLYLDVMKGKEGNPYIAVNTYKPKNKANITNKKYNAKNDESPF